MPRIKSEGQGNHDMTTTSANLIKQRGSSEEDMTHEDQPRGDEHAPQPPEAVGRRDLAGAGLANLCRAALDEAVRDGLPERDPAAYGHLVQVVVATSEQRAA